MREQAVFVLVTHSMVDVARFCDRAIVLHQGSVIFEGKCEPAIACYTQLEARMVPRLDGRKPHQLLEVDRPDVIQDVSCCWCDENGRAVDGVDEGASLYLDVRFRMLYQPVKLIVGVPIYDSKAELICGFSTDGATELPFTTNGEVHLRLCVPEITLNPGRYEAPIAIVDGVEFLFRTQLPDIVVRSRGRLTWGPVTIPHQWMRV